MSWHYLPAPAEESWPACCSDGEPWRPSRLKNTPVRFCCNGKLTDAYLTSLSGTISEHSTVIGGADMSTSSREGSPAKTSAAPGVAPESGAGDPVYGLRWPALSVKYDRHSHSWKIHPSLFADDSIPCSVTLPRSGTMRSGVSWERDTSVRPISVTESGYWPTPTAHDQGATGPGSRHGNGSLKLSGQVGRCARYPTPMQAVGRTGGLNRGGILTPRTYPTPTVTGNHNRKGASPASRDGLATVVKTSVKNGGQLNPAWVEWLMGWPIGWAGLPPLGTGRFQRWRRLHSSYCTSGCGSDAV